MKNLILTVVADQFAVGSPAQQLLDRFLLGYPRDGEFHQLDNCTVRLHLAGSGPNADLDSRQKEHALQVVPDLGTALASANAVLVVPRAPGSEAADALILETLGAAGPRTSCFIYGTLGSHRALKRVFDRMDTADLKLGAGTATAVTWHLPETTLPPGTQLKEALIVVQGPPMSAELDGLEGLLPVIEGRAGRQAGVNAVKFFSGEDLWKQGEAGAWSWRLLAAALSRSDSPQGDPVADGRTQDLVRLGLVPKLARHPRGWLVEHRDGLRSSILVLDGVVADYNFAVQTAEGHIHSAQLYRPPKPPQHQFSRLAAVLEDFFDGAALPWTLERSVLSVELIERFNRESNGATSRA